MSRSAPLAEWLKRKTLTGVTTKPHINTLVCHIIMRTDGIKDAGMPFAYSSCISNYKKITELSKQYKVIIKLKLTIDRLHY